ncbi:restriction endonuclease [Alteromonas sp. ASW11-36]|uniref:Restriction endonuclease n=1 Tax=Alteromonas arenosi TaxID=3055817 RepID=A0ABT7SWK4_9ALTE|nr:restriction endonuclease [Alteromonas sp. ASW11-36]MDM7860559.1 restriction endonuclease [Alteromonas sp. ASW11-36]
MITNKVPDTWQDLQNETARILAECGFSVEVEKIIDTARGKVEIDVYAEEKVKGRKYTILCECKHWKGRVPQNVIHGFRTVTADIGANVSYLISLNGFQVGAFSAAKHTNTKLVTWEEFQNHFEQSWFDEYLSPNIAKKLNAIMTYSEPLLPSWFAALPEAKKAEYVTLKNKYDLFGALVMEFTPYARMFEDTKRPSLPLIKRLDLPPSLLATIPTEILEAISYREFFESCLDYGLTAIEEFRSVRDRS